MKLLQVIGFIVLFSIICGLFGLGYLIPVIIIVGIILGVTGKKKESQETKVKNKSEASKKVWYKTMWGMALIIFGGIILVGSIVSMAIDSGHNVNTTDSANTTSKIDSTIKSSNIINPNCNELDYITINKNKFKSLIKIPSDVTNGQICYDNNNVIITTTSYDKTRTITIDGNNQFYRIKFPISNNNYYYQLIINGNNDNIQLDNSVTLDMTIINGNKDNVSWDGLLGNSKMLSNNAFYVNGEESYGNCCWEEDI